MHCVAVNITIIYCIVSYETQIEMLSHAFLQKKRIFQTKYNYHIFCSNKKAGPHSQKYLISQSYNLFLTVAPFYKIQCKTF